MDDLVFDIGMLRGEDTAYYLAKGYAVVGVEANPDLAEHCRRRFQGQRVTVIEGAIAESEEPTISFFRHPNAVWGTISADRAKRNLHAGKSEELTVPVIDLKALLADHGVPHYMKIDIEGAGLLCLRSLSAFSKKPAFLSIEASYDEPEELAAEFDLLEELGYRRFSVVQQATVPDSVVETATLGGESLRYQFEADASGPFGEDLSTWVDRRRAEWLYRRARIVERAFPHKMLRRSQVGRGIRGQALRVLGPLPGWFDTHAAL